MKIKIWIFLKRLYQALPFKLGIFKFIRFWTIPSFSIRKRLGFTGIVSVNLPDGQKANMMNYDYDFLTDYFWFHGESDWDKVSLKLWFDLSKKAEIILDIGANIGIYAVFAQMAQPNAQVIAFEPQPNIFDRLCQNSQLNRLNIICEPIALSDKTEKARFYNGGYQPFLTNSTSGTLNSEFHKTNQDFIEVHCMTLANYIEKKNLPKIDLMKIDVESLELQVLNGMGSYLAQHKPRVIIEILNDEIGIVIQKIFSDLGYHFFYIDEKKGLTKVENLSGRTYFNYFLTPKSEDLHIN